MSKANATHTTTDEVVLAAHDLHTVEFDGCHWQAARIDGAAWFRDWDLIDMLDRDPEEAEALFARLEPGEAVTAVVDGREVGFISAWGALNMCLGCSDVVQRETAASRFFRWLAAENLLVDRQSPALPASAKRYGHLACIQGGRA